MTDAARLFAQVGGAYAFRPAKHRPSVNLQQWRELHGGPDWRYHVHETLHAVGLRLWHRVPQAILPVVASAEGSARETSRHGR